MYAKPVLAAVQSTVESSTCVCAVGGLVLNDAWNPTNVSAGPLGLTFCAPNLAVRLD